MSNIFIEKGQPKNGLSYAEFSYKTNEFLDSVNPNDLSGIESVRLDYKKLNVHRVNRIMKTYKPGEEINELIQGIDSKQYWYILTEDWCGDSAQNLPYIYKMTELDENIELRIFQRDENPELMDNYLTNGNRSIPKLIAFDEEGNELFQWGPRPQAAQQLVKQMINEGIEKKERNEKLHLWYGRNRGKDIEKEFIEILKNVLVTV